MSRNKKTLDWIDAVLEGLSRVDPDAVLFIRAQRVLIDFRKQGPHTGAIWFPGKRIFLNPKYYSVQTDSTDPFVYSILIHEVRHLQQGFFTALSVYGELDAWQLGFRVYRDLTGQPFHPGLVELMSLPLNWDRSVLRRAQVLMRAYAGKSYRADLLPLYPLGREIRYWLGF